MAITVSIVGPAFAQTNRFFFSSRRRHTILVSDWSSDVCSSDLPRPAPVVSRAQAAAAAHPVWAEVTAGPDGKPAARAKVDAQIGRASCRERESKTAMASWL